MSDYGIIDLFKLIIVSSLAQSCSDVSYVIHFIGKLKLAKFSSFRRETILRKLIFQHPDVITVLGDIFGHFDSRLQMLDRLLRIQGKLSLLLDRASSAAVAKNAYADQPAEVVYEEGMHENQNIILAMVVPRSVNP